MFDKYAPVVSWTTVTIILVFSLVLGLVIQQVHYNSSFCQAPLEQTVYVELPRKFEILKMTLLLQQYIYGLHQSLLKFYKRLHQGSDGSVNPIMMTDSSLIVQ